MSADKLTSLTESLLHNLLNFACPLDPVADLCVVVSPAGRVVGLSASYVRAVGLEPADVVGQLAAELYPALEPGALDAALARAVASGAAEVLPDVACTAPGTTTGRKAHVLRPTLSALWAAGPGECSVILRLDDVTQVVAAAEVAQRAREAADRQRELSQAEELLHAANQGLDRAQLGRGLAPLVLIIDDDAFTRAVVADSLASAFRTAEAADGTEGLVMVKQLNPDLVVLDLVMPGLGGRGTLAALRELPGYADTPVMVLSASADEATRADLLRRGAQDCLTKPFARGELEARAQNLVSAKLGREATLRRADTAVRHVERELADATGLFESLAQLAPVGIFRTNADGRLVYVNPRWRDLAGLDPAEAVVGDWKRILHPDDRGRLAVELSSFAGGVPSRGEGRLMRPDGTVAWVEAQLAVLQGPDGRLLGYVGTLFDVTARRQTEAALRTLSSSSRGQRNDPFFDLIVRRLSELSEMDIAFVGRLHGDPLDRVRTLAVSRNGAPSPNVDFALDGTPFELIAATELGVIARDARARFPRDPMLAELGVESVAASPLLDGAGRRVGLLGLLGTRPLTDPGAVVRLLELFEVRTAAEVERQRSSRRFADLFELAPDALLMVTETGTVTLANRQAEQMFGYTRKELVGASVEQLMPGVVKAGHLREGFSARSSRTTARRSAVGCRKNSTMFPVELMMSPMDSEDGRVVAAAVRDMTERQQALDDLERASDRLRVANGAIELEGSLLSRRVTERTAALEASNRQLEQATADA